MWLGGYCTPWLPYRGCPGIWWFWWHFWKGIAPMLEDHKNELVPVYFWPGHCSETAHVSVVIIQLLSCIWLFATPWVRGHQASLSFTHSQPRVCSNSCPLSQWCCLTISSSPTLFFCFQSFWASGSLPMSHLFTSGGQSIGVSASASVLPMNIQNWFPLGLTSLIFL